MTSIFASSRALAGIAVALGMLIASPAAAQRVLFLSATGEPYCDTAPSCTAPSETCTDLPGTMCTALSLAGHMEQHCVNASLVQYCCETDTDCPILRDAAAHCGSPTVGDPSFEHGLCVYGPLNPCLGMLRGRTDAEVVSACFRDSSGHGTGPYGTSGFASGDCDSDGVPNREDLCLCDPDNACVTMLDAGVPPDTDAGVPTDIDAGPESDAGPVEPLIDAGTVDIDANLPPGTGLDFRGAGGCACSASGAAGPSGGSLAALLALGGAVALRLRRRFGGRSTRKAA